MALIKEVFNGYAQRIRMENSFQLQKAKLIRPPQVKLEVANTLKGIYDELKDPELKALFDACEIKAPD